MTTKLAEQQHLASSPEAEACGAQHDRSICVGALYHMGSSLDSKLGSLFGSPMLYGTLPKRALEWTLLPNLKNYPHV